MSFFEQLPTIFRESVLCDGQQKRAHYQQQRFGVLTQACAAMPDAVELEIQIEWLQRQLEEREALVASLRKTLEALLGESHDFQLRANTLKTVQDALLREKLLAERHVELLQKEKAELASENARMHVFAKDCSAKADAAVRVADELRAIAAARARAEDLVLSSAGQHMGSGGAVSTRSSPTPPPKSSPSSSASSANLEARLQAARIVMSRLLVLAARSGLVLSREQLLGPPGLDAAGGGLGSPRPPSPGRAGENLLEAELAATLCQQLGLTAAVQSSAAGSSADATAAAPSSPSSPSLLAPTSTSTPVELAEANNVATPHSESPSFRAAIGGGAAATAASSGRHSGQGAPSARLSSRPVAVPVLPSDGMAGARGSPAAAAGDADSESAVASSASVASSPAVQPDSARSDASADGRPAAHIRSNGSGSAAGGPGLAFYLLSPFRSIFSVLVGDVSSDATSMASEGDMLSRERRASPGGSNSEIEIAEVEVGGYADGDGVGPPLLVGGNGAQLHLAPQPLPAAEAESSGIAATGQSMAYRAPHTLNNSANGDGISTTTDAPSAVSSSSSSFAVNGVGTAGHFHEPTRTLHLLAPAQPPLSGGAPLGMGKKRVSFKDPR